MARNKYPEETVDLILDTATTLFLKNGYEQTTIQDIVDNLGGLTRGAIYHHFKSKEDIIDAVTTRFWIEGELAKKVLEQNGMTGLEKLRSLFMNSLTMQKNSAEIYRSAADILKNPKFLAQQIKELQEVISPIICIFLEEGNRDGTIKTENPKLTSEAILLLTNIWCVPSIFPSTQQEMMQKVYFLKDLLDKLGVPLLDEEVIQCWKEYIDVIVPAGE